MNDFIIYLLIGTVSTFFIEVIMRAIIGQTFSMSERLFSIICWPFTLLVFIIAMFR